MSRTYDHTVEEFENRLCEYTGAPYAIAIDSCTNAILLACEYCHVAGFDEITIPCRTYPGVPCSIIHAGGRVKFEDISWDGIYNLRPTNIWDYAKRFKKLMYVHDRIQCVSFHGKKILNIGRGGAILTNNEALSQWAKKARFDGRDPISLHADEIISVGHSCYMQPEQAARGMTLLDFLSDDNKDLEDTYPDLSGMPVKYQEYNRANIR